MKKTARKKPTPTITSVYEVRLPLADWVFIVSATTPRRAVASVIAELSGDASPTEPFEVAVHRAPRTGTGVWRMGKTYAGHFDKEEGTIAFN